MFILWSIIKVFSVNPKQGGFLLCGMALLTIFICHVEQKRLDQYENLNGQQPFELIIKSDQFKLNEGFISGQAEIINRNQNILFSGKINSQQFDRINELSNRSFVLKVNATVNDVDSGTNFNQFDLANYYKTQRIVKSLKINNISSIELLDTSSIDDKIHQFRAGLIRYSEQLPHPLSLYFSSLVLGVMDQSLMDEISGMRQLGLIHLFSISGFHVYFLIRLLELLLVKLKIKIETVQLLIIFLLPLYFIFAGSSIGLFRSVLTSEIRAFLKLLGLKFSELNVWSLVLLVNIFWSPQCFLQLGCQLSYVLSFGLLFVKKFNFLQETLVMNLLGVPIIIFHLFEWHVLSLVANWIILPLFSILVMPLVILGGVIFPVLPLLSQLVAEFISFLDLGVNFLSTLPGNILFGKPTWWLCGLSLILTLLLFDGITRKKLALLVIMYTIIFTIIHFPTQGEVSFFDVGQGDSFLIREPFNRSITLIDTGGRLNFGKNNSNEKYKATQTSINYLKSLGINQIDNICISHQDADHCGDLPAFIRSMKIKRIYFPAGMQNNASFMQKLNVKAAGKAPTLVPVLDGSNIGKTSLLTYHPLKPGMGKNEDSMVIGGNIGGIDWLFTGDLDRSGELETINKYPHLRTSVLKLGHHGSKTSSDPAFLDLVKSKVVIISAGRNNRYHHPDDETINNIKQRNLKIYNTQEDGMISYRYKGRAGYFDTKLRGVH